MDKKTLFVILGPTASGKTKLAVNLANTLNGEIISADSRQVFEGMDIGTGKDLEEYIINGRKIPYHLIDIRKAGESYNVNEFKEDFYSAFKTITEKNALPILCGGTGMYIHSILQNHEYTAIPQNAPLRSMLEELDVVELRNILSAYSPEFTAHADLSSRKRLIRAIEVSSYLTENTLKKIERPTFNPFVIGLTLDVGLRRKRIIDRLDLRLKQGLINEVEQLINEGVSKEKLIFYGLEYKFVVSYLSGEIDFDMLKDKLGIAICQFAKRQMTFFRKMEKDGIEINWIDSDHSSDLLPQALSLYDKYLSTKS
ncbi:MAG: tRNA (adenosine(37)-N6)-dimethylallyltransferase MiaA [Candidatus Pedobacter colombiensis]|uniref:tRNA dimethylallyltransferase n=1 Tax=Candidatus Pedobacter colombiensis TaxID=3121371 RepID=A0AAJ5W9H8_9SPHI|nr:tRNA (adenosine(37)-N6)-dimethylallyltransferase MiaA [Pedobacter sp.]WEK21248.1 MAG: tRNA (adenosine(37)-N6)-dimethylallyltransferase MiaA [Pedobacter sp.]